VSKQLGQCVDCNYYKSGTIGTLPGCKDCDLFHSMFVPKRKLEIPRTHFIKLDVLRAKGLGDQEVTPLLINVNFDTPEKATVEEYDMLFDDDAKQLEAALIHHLPGGTYDRLLGYMLRRKSNHYIVPLVSEAEEEKVSAEIESATDMGVTQGIALAVAEVIRQFGDKQIAKSVLGVCGIRSLKELREMVVSECDIEALKSVLPEEK
jgi:hypothetical protein